jgi:hypothetical protein
MKDVPTGSRAVNWVEPSKIPVWDTPEEALKDITFSTNTSVIQCQPEPALNCYYISIKHKSVSQTVHISVQAMQQSYEHAINYAMQEMYYAFDDGETSLKVIKNLFLTMFGDVANQSEIPKSITKQYSISKENFDSQWYNPASAEDIINAYKRNELQDNIEKPMTDYTPQVEDIQP